jgi:parallel beta-helix repeat protein
MSNALMKRILTAARAAVLFPVLALHGQTIVTNTNDSGPGSLRQVILDANASTGAVFVTFRIPKTDPGFNPANGVWTIRPMSGFPTVVCPAIEFKGETQSAFTGEDTNPLGPEIEIDGSLAGAGQNGLTARGCIVADFYLLTINRFGGAGILAQNVASGGYVAGCYVGTDPTGMERAGNGYGVILDSCRYFNVTSFDTVRSVISGNENYGLGLVYGSCFNHVYGNFIGLNRTGTDTIGNGNYGGIRVSDGSDSNFVRDNVISGNQLGICLFNASGNTIMENTIGGPPPGSTGTWSGGGNRFGGVAISAYGSDVTEHNQLDANEISGNGRMGVRVVGAGSRFNMINRNVIFANEEGAINLEDSANEGIAAPVLESFDGNFLSGTTTPNSSVQLFTDNGRQASRYLDYTGTDEHGHFIFSLGGSTLLANFTALVTDAKGNSSALCLPLSTTSGVAARGSAPSEFRLDPVYPNPFNPTATVRFSVDRPCRVRLTVIDLIGRTVAVLADGPREASVHTVIINASALPSGSYLVRMVADEGRWAAVRAFSVVK